MSKVKNALNKYEIAPFDPEFDDSEGYGTFEGTFLRLARGITDVNDASDETVDDVAYFDGDGTAESEVSAVKMGYDFEGQYIDSDPAMAYVRGVESLSGDARKVVFRVTRVKVVDGVVTPILTYTGKATLANVVTSGGNAADYEAFSCGITYDRQPTIDRVDEDEGGDEGGGEGGAE